MLLGVPLHTADFELVAIDMPGCGCTEVVRCKAVSYDDWVQLASDFIDYELEVTLGPSCSTALAPVVCSHTTRLR